MSFYTKIKAINHRIENNPLTTRQIIFCGVLAIFCLPIASLCGFYYYENGFLCGFLRSMVYMCLLFTLVAIIQPKMVQFNHRLLGVAFYLMCASLAGLLLPNREQVLADAAAVHRAGKPPNSAKSPASALTTIECRKQLRCWAEKHYHLTWDCKRMIEKQTLTAFKWTDGWLGVKFSHSKWFNEAKGQLVYSGDKIQVQSRYGAWQNRSYACYVDPMTEKVLEVTLYRAPQL